MQRGSLTLNMSRFAVTGVFVPGPVSCGVTMTASDNGVLSIFTAAPPGISVLELTTNCEAALAVIAELPMMTPEGSTFTDVACEPT